MGNRSTTCQRPVNIDPSGALKLSRKNSVQPKYTLCLEAARGGVCVDYPSMHTFSNSKRNTVFFFFVALNVAEVFSPLFFSRFLFYYVLYRTNFISFFPPSNVCIHHVLIAVSEKYLTRVRLRFILPAFLFFPFFLFSFFPFFLFSFFFFFEDVHHHSSFLSISFLRSALLLFAPFPLLWGKCVCILFKR